jgi:sporulation protein YlmC with PRC-barrel domain
MRIDAGTTAECTDGAGGEVVDVVVDPVRRRLTHLVVRPAGQADERRLVPVEAVEAADGQVTLSWSIAQLMAAPAVQETRFLQLDGWPHAHDGWDVGISRVFAWPYYSSTDLGVGGWRDPGPTAVSYDRIPAGTAEIRRASAVVSSDDHLVGHVEGFVVDPGRGITHLVLEHGHLWAHREITLPVDDVESVATDAVRLRITRDAVGQAPTAPFVRHR